MMSVSIKRMTALVVALHLFSHASIATGQVFDAHPFDISLGELPQNYRGANLRELTSAFNSLETKEATYDLINRQSWTFEFTDLHLKPRSEFETQPQFQERLRLQQEKKLIGDIDLRSRIAVSLKVWPEHIRYNIDTKTISFQLNPTNEKKSILDLRDLRLGLGSDHCQIKYRLERYRSDALRQLGDCERNLSEHAIAEVRQSPVTQVRRQTAGGSFRVSDEQVIDAFAVMFNCEARCPQFSRMSLELNASVDEGRRMKDTTSVLIIGRLAAGISAKRPLVSVWRLEEGPTAQRPHHLVSRLNRVPMQVESLWFYDAETGRILKKVSPVRARATQ